MDKYANFREDQWGGNTENRVRFCKEVIGALLESFPANRIGIKLNPCGGMNDVGMEKDDTIETYTNLITFLVKTGVAYINLSEPMVSLSRRALHHRAADRSYVQQPISLHLTGSMP